MTNQTAKFGCATADELVVSVRGTKKQIKLTVRHWVAADEAMKTGMVEYFDLGKDADAQQAFDARVQEAEKAGWVPLARTTRPAAFSVIPPAPTKPVEIVKSSGGQTNQAPRAAAGGRR